MARWILVLLLVVDQVGAPLHHHHHDSGIDGDWVPAAAHAAADLHSHVEDEDHGTHFGHATLTLRAAGSQSAQVRAVDDTHYTLALMASLFALVLPAEDAVAAGLPRPAWRSPPIRSHRSLPPAGRAPPLLA